MKKLTPFQKKVARWLKKHNVVYSILCGIIAVILFTPFILLYLDHDITRSSPGSLADVKWLLTTFLIMGTDFLVLLYFLALPEKLPESNIDSARKAAEEYPQIADKINQLMDKAIREDDGVEIRRYLKKLRELECLKRPDSDTAKKIAALEKELGM